MSKPVCFHTCIACVYFAYRSHLDIGVWALWELLKMTRDMLSLGVLISQWCAMSASQHFVRGSDRKTEMTLWKRKVMADIYRGLY